MERILIKSISTNPIHGLIVVPASESFEYIYRDASGVRWNRDIKALVAYEPIRWVHRDLFEQILFAVRNEYGVELFIGAETIFESLDDDVKSDLIKTSHKFPERMTN